MTKRILTEHLRRDDRPVLEWVDAGMPTACGRPTGTGDDIASDSDMFRSVVRNPLPHIKVCPDCLAILVDRDLEEALDFHAFRDLARARFGALRNAIKEIDALHIEWGATSREDFDQLVMWERLGRILRKAGI